MIATGSADARIYELSGAWHLLTDIRNVTERRLGNIEGIDKLVGVNVDLLNMMIGRIEEEMGDGKRLLPENKIDPNMLLRNAAPQ